MQPIFAILTFFLSGRAAMGSPVLLYYHRDLLYIAGFIYAFFGGLKASVVATIAVFLAVGAYGMRQVLGVVTNSRLLCTVGSVGFLFTNVHRDRSGGGDLGEGQCLGLYGDGSEFRGILKQSALLL